MPGLNRAVAKPFEVASYTVPFSTARGTPAKPLPALPVVSVSASSADGATVAEDTLAGRLGTRWLAFGPGPWLAYGPGQTRRLGYGEIAFFNGDGRKTYFDIQGSADGSSWRTVYGGQSSGTTRELETFFARVQTRCVRLVGYGSSANLWNGLTEVVLHGQQTPFPGKNRGRADGLGKVLSHPGGTSIMKDHPEFPSGRFGPCASRLLGLSAQLTRLRKPPRPPAGAPASAEQLYW